MILSSAILVIRTDAHAGVAGWKPATVVIAPASHVAQAVNGDGRVAA